MKALPFIAFTLVAAATAAAAAYASVSLTLPIWAMFLGWVAYFTRGHSSVDGAVNLACLVLGLGFGMGAAVSLSVLVPALGTLAFAVVVFVVASIVVSLRALPPFNNVLAYFLGLIGFFAAHAEPTLADFSELAASGTLGSVAAWASQRMQSRLVPAH